MTQHYCLDFGSNPFYQHRKPKGKVLGFLEYKGIHIVEGGLGIMLLGESGMLLKKMETALNREAAEGGSVAFQIVEQKCFLLFWKREAVIITMGR